jgi:hypothetical protein
MPGSRAPCCSSIERASTAKRSTPLANTAGSNAMMNCPVIDGGPSASK